MIPSAFDVDGVVAVIVVVSGIIVGFIIVNGADENGCR